MFKDDSGRPICIGRLCLLRSGEIPNEPGAQRCYLRIAPSSPFPESCEQWQRLAGDIDRDDRPVIAVATLPFCSGRAATGPAQGLTLGLVRTGLMAIEWWHEERLLMMPGCV